MEDESEEKNLVHLLDMAVSDGVTTSMRLHRLCLFASFLALKMREKREGVHGRVQDSNE